MIVLSAFVVNRNRPAIYYGRQGGDNVSDSKCARMLTVFVMAALVAVSFSAIAFSDDAAADDATYVNNFSDMKNRINSTHIK